VRLISQKFFRWGDCSTKLFMLKWQRNLHLHFVIPGPTHSWLFTWLYGNGYLSSSTSFQERTTGDNHYTSFVTTFYRLRNSSRWIGLHTRRIILVKLAYMIPLFYYHRYMTLSRIVTHYHVISAKCYRGSILLAKKGLYRISHITELLLVSSNSYQIYGKSQFFPVWFFPYI